jgi:hypothetical protein
MWTCQFLLNEHIGKLYGPSLPAWGRFFGRSPGAERPSRVSHYLAGHVFLARAWPARPWSDAPLLRLRPCLPYEEPMDDLKKKGAADRSQINMNEAWEVDFWTHELGVSKDELQKVIKKVGNSAEAVRKELGR